MMKSSRKSRSARQETPILQYADTRKSADQFHSGGFQAPDPFISFQLEGEKVGFFSRLEIGRAGRESGFDTLLSLEEWQDRAGQGAQKPSAGPAEVILLFCRERRLQTVRVGADFPVGLAFALTAGGLEVDVARGMLFPQREFKTDAEAAAIAEGNRCSAAGIRAAERVLRASRIVGRHLVYENRRLTSERLRYEVDRACLERGALAEDTIVAGGVQACDPHCRGSGALRANELIIVDVFPRVAATGYYGDMTRTFLKGRASEAQKHLVATVRAGQQLALGRIKAGVSGMAIHRAVSRYFESQGYRTGETAAGPVGFFHGTGHGLGLEVHEPPRISAVGPRLRRNQVVTVEPGLYYPEIGGCRIEDVVRVGSGGAESLSKCHYRWQIR